MIIKIKASRLFLLLSMSLLLGGCAVTVSRGTSDAPITRQPIKPINSGAGYYVSPFTSDGELAPWVVNEKIGERSRSMIYDVLSQGFTSLIPKYNYRNPDIESLASKIYAISIKKRDGNNLDQDLNSILASKLHPMMSTWVDGLLVDSKSKDIAKVLYDNLGVTLGNEVIAKAFGKLGTKKIDVDSLEALVSIRNNLSDTLAQELAIGLASEKLRTAISDITSKFTYRGSQYKAAFALEFGKTVLTRLSENEKQDNDLIAFGGWEYIRGSSNLSFNSLSDFRNHLLTYKSDPAFDIAWSAINRLYPEVDGCRFGKVC